MSLLFTCFSTVINKCSTTYITIDNYTFSVLQMIIASVIISGLCYIVSRLLHIND